MPVLRDHTQMTFWCGSPMIIEVSELNAKKLVMKDRVSVKEAARILGLSERRILDMCDSGLLTSIQPGGPKGHRHITLESVIARMQTPD
jgi:hypothetical protein